MRQSRTARAIVLLVLVAFFSAGSTETRGQDVPAIAERLKEALAAADSGTMLSLADERLEIGILRTSQRYSRSQARYVLDAFFSNYPPSEVALAEQAGTTRGRFISATYIPSRGTGPLTVYMRLRATEAGWRMSELIVREED